MRGRADVEDALRVEFFEILVRVIDTGGGFSSRFFSGVETEEANRGQILDKAMTAAKPAEGAGAVSWTFIFPVSRISLHARICANAMREMSTNRALNTRALFSPTILANFFATSTSRVRTAYAASLLLCLDRELEEAISLDKMFECFSANASNSRAHLWFINRTDVFFPDQFGKLAAG